MKRMEMSPLVYSVFYMRLGLQPAGGDAKQWLVDSSEPIRKASEVEYFIPDASHKASTIALCVSAPLQAAWFPFWRMQAPTIASQDPAIGILLELYRLVPALDCRLCHPPEIFPAT